jgi:hypothetical protein
MVAEKSTLPHIKSLCTIEMISRVCKKLIRFYLTQMIIDGEDKADEEIQLKEISKSKI